MRIIDTHDPDVFAVEALPTRRAIYTVMLIALTACILLGLGPFDDLALWERVFGAAVIDFGAIVMVFGRFGAVIDRRRMTLCNWYDCLGLGIRWTFPMRPQSVRIEWRMGGHRDVSDLTYTQHLFLLNQFGSPLRIGRVRTSTQAHEIAAAIAEFLQVPIEEGSPRPADQICVPWPWPDFFSGFFTGARLCIGNPAREAAARGS